MRAERWTERTTKSERMTRRKNNIAKRNIDLKEIAWLKIIYTIVEHI